MEVTIQYDPQDDARDPAPSGTELRQLHSLLGVHDGDPFGKGKPARLEGLVSGKPLGAPR